VAPALGLFLIVMGVVFWPGLEQPGESPRQALLLVSAPLLLLLACLGPSAPRPAAFLVLTAVPLLSAIAHAFLASPAEGPAVARDAASLCALAMVGLCAALCPPGPEEPSSVDGWIERAAVVCLFAVGLLGLAQAWLGWQGLPQSSPPAATFMNRNLAAAMLVPLLPLASTAMLAERRPLARWLSALAVGVGAALLVATRTRGAWLGALAGAAAALLVGWRRRPAWPLRPLTAAPIAAALLIVLVSLAVPVAGPEPVPTLAGRLSSFAAPLAGTGAIRAALWRNSWSMIEDEPIVGHGAGRFPVAYPLYQQARVRTPLFGTERQPEHAENDWLEFAAELGLPAALALVIVFAGALVRLARRSSARSAAQMAALAGLLVHALVSFPLHHSPTAWLAWVLAGRAWSVQAPRARAMAPVWRATLAGAAVLLLLAASAIARAELRARARLADALRAEERQACGEALAAAQDAVRAAPWLRREQGLAAMVHFACDREAQRSLVPLERALAMQPHQLNLLLAVGARRLKAGDPAAAEEAFRHALRVAPDLARAWLGVAMSREAAFDRAGSEQACRRALALEPGLEPARAFCGG
jgi:O-antigen ligase